MNWLHKASVGAVILTGLVVVTAFADAPWLTLMPGARVDYRMDYRGDSSAIQVIVESSDPANTLVAFYTPIQIEALQQRGEQPKPIGLGTMDRTNKLVWSGGFNSAGVYHVFVENRSAVPLAYRIDISGAGVSGAAQVRAVAPQTTSKITVENGQTILNVAFPPNTGAANLKLVVPSKPANCTPANQMPATIVTSLKLCPNEIYPPLKIVGDHIALFADDARTAIVTSAGRQFAVTVDGSNNWIDGLTISARADPQDLGAWLCLYDACLFPTKPLTTTVRGGILYGGGVLLRGSNSTVRGVTVRGGTIGIATVNGRANNLIDNQLSELNGWGSFNLASTNSYFVGNVLNRNNHGCTTPDGRNFLHGCETSGWVCLGCQANSIVSNHCELSANCFYMSGERNLASNDNRFIANYCSGASDNCFEVTFSQRNFLVDNVSTVDAATDMPCKYPFWIGGSVVNFQNNTWQCTISANDAFEQSRDSTVVPTNIINLDAFGAVPIAPAASRVPVVPGFIDLKCGIFFQC